MNPLAKKTELGDRLLRYRHLFQFCMPMVKQTIGLGPYLVHFVRKVFRELRFMLDNSYQSNDFGFKYPKESEIMPGSNMTSVPIPEIALYYSYVAFIQFYQLNHTSLVAELRDSYIRANGSRLIRCNAVFPSQEFVHSFAVQGFADLRDFTFNTRTISYLSHLSSPVNWAYEFCKENNKENDDWETNFQELNWEEIANSL